LSSVSIVGGDKSVVVPDISDMSSGFSDSVEVENILSGDSVSNVEGVHLMICFVECVKPVSEYTKDEAGVLCLELSSNTCSDLRLVLPLKYRSTEINVAHSLGQFSFKETV